MKRSGGGSLDVGDYRDDAGRLPIEDWDRKLVRLSLRYINDPFDTKHCGAHHQESAKGNYEARSLIVSAAVLVLTQPLLGRGSDTFNKNATESHIFHANCAVCHGMDGAESQAGKSLHAPDLRTNKIQMQSDATIARFINEGNGSMPSFKESLKR